LSDKPKKQCSACYWFEMGADGVNGVCFLNPPVPVPVMVQGPVQRPGQAAAPSAFSIRPPTAATARCRHWMALK
jgi:hypothetical protein